jgi:hypothetical protein
MTIVVDWEYRNSGVIERELVACGLSRTEAPSAGDGVGTIEEEMIGDRPVWKAAEEPTMRARE